MSLVFDSCRRGRSCDSLFHDMWETVRVPQGDASTQFNSVIALCPISLMLKSLQSAEVGEELMQCICSVMFELFP